MSKLHPSAFTLADKVELYMTRFLRLTLLVAIGMSAFQLRWSLMIITVLIFLLTFAPLLFEKRTRIRLPLEFELVIVLFIYASLFLGEVGDYYLKFWWWDLLLHGFSSLAMGFVGFLILYILHAKNRLETRPIWVAIFAFTFAVAAGSLWEIFEFMMDRTFGMNMQKSGLMDTMGDMILNATGALITSTIGYFYLNGKKIGLFRRLMERFGKANPHLLEKI